VTTPTGRSPQEPKLAQLPIRTELGKRIREAFRQENQALLTADYTDIELRLMAFHHEEEV
jgi:DNA polymerase-1